MKKTLSYKTALKAAIAAAFSAALLMPASAQAPSLRMLDDLTAGLWEIRDRETQQRQKICVKTGRDLIQLRHQGASCRRVVVEDSATEVTVQYTCPGLGYGRTNIRRESSSLIQIEAQGIAGKRNYEFTAEGRRTGTC